MECSWGMLLQQRHRAGLPGPSLPDARCLSFLPSSRPHLLPLDILPVHRLGIKNFMKLTVRASSLSAVWPCPQDKVRLLILALSQSRGKPR